MTDDLVTRVLLSVGLKLGKAVRARIEQDAVTIARLTGERDAMFRRAHLAEEWRDHDKERAEAAEAKVAALVEALQKIAEWPDYRLPKPCDIARAAIAAAKGE